MDDTQHVFIIKNHESKYVYCYYLGEIPYTDVSSRLTETARGEDFTSQVFDASQVSKTKAYDYMKTHYRIDPQNEDFYPINWPDTPVGELQEIFGIRPEYEPNDIPFDELVKWRDQALKAEQEAILGLLPAKRQSNKKPLGINFDGGFNTAIDLFEAAIKERMGTQG